MNPPSSAKPIAFYVSPDGDDDWSGHSAKPNPKTHDGPFATLEKARDAVRALKAKGAPHGPVTVYLRGGRYGLSRPFVLTPDDSGAEKAAVTYAAYRSEKPVLSGGRVIAGWKRGEGGLWTAHLPAVQSGEWDFRQLFVNGKRRRRARAPNDGYFKMDGMPTADDPARFKYRDGDIKKEWADRGDVEAVSLAKWAGFRMPIARVDEATKTVTLPGKVYEHIRENDQRYYIENLREALDQPGEWYLDRKAGTLFYWPMPGEDMAHAEAVAPALTQLVRFEGDPSGGKYVRNVTLRGLTFEHTAWTMDPGGYVDMQAAYTIPAAVEANGAIECAVEKCRFVHLGNYAVEFAQGCKRNGITGNEMTDLGAGGVKIGEPQIRDDEARQTTHNVVSDNRIYDIGKVYPTGIGVWIGQSAYNRIAHNLIHDTYYTAISDGWTWGYGPSNAHHNVIEYNHAYNIGRGLLSDMGGIYTLGVQPGTIIRNNLFHDISSWDYGGWGIYTDEGSSGILIENNVVYNTKTGGFHQHYGRENVIRNNIFVNSRQGQIIRTRQEDHLSFTFEGNIVYWKDGPLLGSNWNGNDTYKMDRNVYWKEGGQPFDFAGASLAEWQGRGQDVHSVIADPLFEDPQKHDFRLKPGSPALKLGFKPIDLSEVGPRNRR